MVTSPVDGAEVHWRNVLQHPEYKNIIWDLPPVKKEKIPVARGRGGPFEISYEIHGHGDTKLVWIMGLGTFKTAWQRQTKHFCHEEPRASEYTSLIYDNRGMGESDKPGIRYTTSEMAKDTLELLEHVGWTGKRQLHVIGGFWEHLRSRINLFIPRHIDIMVANLKVRLYANDWLEAPDQDGNFPTNGDRVAALEIHKRSDKDGFTRKGFLLQAIAANWHYKSPAHLKELGDEIGRDRIMVVHGTKDNMITFPHGEILAKELGEGVEFKVFEGRGHALCIEERDEFNRLLENFVHKTKRLGRT
ncbi:putative alpha beta hydrolase [Phaeomoniella chlamydospora]|uniref:Putative alpha beta hydrolase n=1 Tax=Phaeomoniella chlamydospora TaxID=158046 RepID=A0A0G2GTB8_PHACM|nr:putative alpha beta hydrolase [Phaeomoniella chlamydospora]